MIRSILAGINIGIGLLAILLDDNNNDVIKLCSGKEMYLEKNSYE